MPAYEERYVAFVDILGFRGPIEGLTAGRIASEGVRTLLRTVHEPPRLDTVTLDNAPDFKVASGEFRAQSISDAVVLSADLNLGGLYHICFSVTELALRLLPKGLFIRGAITKGKLYHDDKTVFGAGLVRAYDV